MRKCPLFSTEKADLVISFSSSLKLGQACGRLGEGQTSGAVQDEANQYRRVTVDDKTGPSSEKIDTLVRISQTPSLFLSTPPTHDTVTQCFGTTGPPNALVSFSQPMFSRLLPGGGGKHEAGAHAAILGLSPEDCVQRQSGHWHRGRG